MAQQQLQQAHDLIEQGKLTEARRLLLTIDDPVARQWLAQIDPNKVSYKRRRSSLPIPLGALFAAAAVIGVVALIVIILLTPALLARVQSPAAPSLTADEALYASLQHVCTMTTGNDMGEACMDWTDLVLRDHHDAAAACVGVADVETDSGRALVVACLTQNGVPAPA